VVKEFLEQKYNTIDELRVGFIKMAYDAEEKGHYNPT
jgi:hypothetical protein